MKKILIVFVAALLTTGAFSQSRDIDRFFDRLEDGDEYAVVTVNKQMFKMLSSLDVEFEEKGIKELIEGIELVKIFIREDEADINDYNELKSLVEGGSMDNLISVKDKGERVHLYTGPSSSDNIVNGLVLLVHEDTQNVFIKMDGKINLEHLSKLTESIHIDGLEHLKHLDKKQ